MQISFNTPYQAHLKTQRFAGVKKEKNVVKSQDVSFPKSQELFASRAQRLPQTKAGAVVT